MKTQKYLLLLLTILSLILCSCKDEIVTPNDPPGRRDYVWSVDTLSKYSDLNKYFNLTGASPNDVWLAGYGDEFLKNILHYNGRKIEIVPPDNVISDSHALYCNKNQLWLGGLSGDIYKYEQSRFILKKKFYNKDNFYITDFTSDINDNLYAVGCYDTDKGLQGVIMRYNNNEWAILDTLHGTNNQFDKISINNTGEIYLSCVYGNQNDSIAIYKYLGHKLIPIYNEKDRIATYFKLTSINNKTYAVMNKKLLSLDFDKFNIVKDFTQYDIQNTFAYGRSLNDIFLKSQAGIAHYNGTDVKDIFKIGQGSLIKALLYEKDVFFIFVEAYTYKFYFIHGRINN
jgi:hypothetical protein